MDQLHPTTAFGVDHHCLATSSPTYWYTGRCPQTGVEHRLPRTVQAEAIARGLMQHLATTGITPSEGKMYGVLLVRTATGDQGVLKAFSGLLQGQRLVAGWVPAIPGHSQLMLAEAQTLAELDQIKATLLTLQSMPERADYARLTQAYGDRLQELADHHRARKQDRDRQRQTYAATLKGDELAMALKRLVVQSQQDGRERRRLKQERDQALSSLQVAIAQADQAIRALKQQRQALSRQLQAQMHAVYSLTNFAGRSTTLEALLPTGMPTGTGDCAAPKLLHYAATHRLQPLALAEFWWGPAQGDKHPGHFYGACVERCQPILGFLLSGLPTVPAPSIALSTALPILYQDEALIVVDKPTGLLSVPGRTSRLQDSVLSRLRCQLQDGSFLKAVHRLDKGTSGLLILATSPEAHRVLGQQFAQRQVKKTYAAILSRPVTMTAGAIDLPLWRNPADRPKQSVDWQRGKSSLTEFQITDPGETPRVRFTPHTGRTHQLRVHAAHPQGLNAPILGDTLYSPDTTGDRLYLHATTLQFRHPITQIALSLISPVPF